MFKPCDSRIKLDCPSPSNRSRVLQNKSIILLQNQSTAALTKDKDVKVDNFAKLTEIPINRRDDKNPFLTRITFTRERIWDTYRYFIFDIFWPYKKPSSEMFNFEVGRVTPHWKYINRRDGAMYNEINWELSPDLKIAKFHRTEFFSAIGEVCCFFLCFRLVLGFIFSFAIPWFMN